MTEHVAKKEKPFSVGEFVKDIVAHGCAEKVAIADLSLSHCTIAHCISEIASDI